MLRRSTSMMLSLRAMLTMTALETLKEDGTIDQILDDAEGFEAEKQQS
ncbi:hypothetical protein ACFPFV_12700 [Salinicoccus siamensis]